MDILVGNVIACAIYALIIYSLPIKQEHKNNFYFLITFVQITLIHGLVDPDCVPDLGNYESAWRRYINFSLWDTITLNDGSAETFEQGFRTYMKVISYFTSNYQAFLVINSGLMFLLYYIFFRKYSPYFWFSVLLLLLVSYNQSLFVLRQHLSIAVLFVSYPYILKKDLKRFSIVVLIAYLLHNSSLIFLPVYFLYNIKDTKRYFFTMIGSSILLSIVIMTAISRYGFIFTRNEFFIENAVEGVATKALIMGAILIVYLLVLREKAFEEGINKLVFTISILGIVGNALVGESGGGRIFWSYYIIVIIQVPLIMYYMKLKVIKFIFCISVLAVFMAWAFVLAGDVIFWSDFKLNI